MFRIIDGNRPQPRLGRSVLYSPLALFFDSPDRGAGAGERPREAAETGLVLLTCVQPPTCAAGRVHGCSSTPHEKQELPLLEVVWADQGYAGPFGRWLDQERGWQL